MDNEGFRFYFTKKGKILCSKTQIGTQLYYSRAMLGTGFWPNDVSPSDMTDLIEPKMPINITSLDARDDGTAYIELTVTNESINKGFFAREIAIYAIDPDEGEIVYVIGYAGDEASFIPAYTGNEAFEEAFGIYIPIGEAENIDANITKAERAKNISYDNTKTNLRAKDTQEAVDEIALSFAEYKTAMTAFLTQAISRMYSGILPDINLLNQYLNGSTPDGGIDSVLIETAPYTADAKFLIEYQNGEIETVTNMTDDPQTAKDNDIIVEYL